MHMNMESTAQIEIIFKYIGDLFETVFAKMKKELILFVLKKRQYKLKVELEFVV